MGLKDAGFRLVHFKLKTHKLPLEKCSQVTMTSSGPPRDARLPHKIFKTKVAQFFLNRNEKAFCIFWGFDQLSSSTVSVGELWIKEPVPLKWLERAVKSFNASVTSVLTSSPVPMLLWRLHWYDFKITLSRAKRRNLKTPLVILWHKFSYDERHRQ